MLLKISFVVLMAVNGIQDQDFLKIVFIFGILLQNIAKGTTNTRQRVLWLLKFNAEALTSFETLVRLHLGFV